MLRTLTRFALLRVLPRRILPIVTVVEAILLLRSIRKRSRVRVNAPSASRTAPPALPATPAAPVADLPRVPASDGLRPAPDPRC